jgi:hypothetical protein
MADNAPFMNGEVLAWVVLAFMLVLLIQTEAATQFSQKLPRSRVERDTYYRQVNSRFCCALSLLIQTELVWQAAR